jgi:hydrogenase expression/formation protein HypD
MRYVDELRDGALGRALAAEIAAAATPGRAYHFMEFCGGHTHALCRYGLLDLLPPGVRMIHGPGCPVCVLPIGRLDQAIDLARRPGVTLCTFGDMMRVPGKDRVSLQRARAEGASVQMVLSPTDALRYAADHPERQVVFFAIGFETTAPTTAAAVVRAREMGLRNLSFFVNHVLTPAAIDAILGSPEARDGTLRVDGFVGPGHVSAIIGYAPYERFARDARKPVVVAGFEPVDLLQAILMLVRQMNEGRAEVENQFTRAVVREGNRKAQALMEETMELREAFALRGLGTLPYSALRLRAAYADLDAEQRFDLPYEHVPDHKACSCGDILKGLKKPTDCLIFDTVCTPENPLGSCMVSPEGSCAAYYLYGRHRNAGETRRTA